MQALAAVIPFPHGETPDMANAAELTTTVATLEERVTNHIKFFWAVVAVGFSWLLGITLLLIHTNGTVTRVEQAQANAPAQIVASLLNKPSPSKSELSADLNAVSTILQSSKVTPKKPDAAAVASVAVKLSEVQQEYPDLPQVWQTTGAFINYKSEVLPATAGFTKDLPCEMTMAGHGFVFSNCEMKLEDLAEHIQGVTVNGSPATFTFINCIIRYNGGAIPAKTLTFVNCIFHFSVPVVPSREGMIAMQSLTTADISKTVEVGL